uniref:Uncharacterized protein n=1 Tax=Parascaris equorum TaxID=6256 RepID=A0A914RPX4_PAREQ
MFVRIAAYHVQQMRISNSHGTDETISVEEKASKGEESASEISDIEKKATDDEAIVSQIKIMEKAAMAVDSIRNDEFDMRFNPDCYCTTVQHADSEDLAKQRRLIAELAEFLLVQVCDDTRLCLFLAFCVFSL